MSSSCRSLEAERGGGGVGEMVHLDPGPEPSHKLREPALELATRPRGR